MGIAVGMLLSEVLVLLFVFVIYRGSMAGRREAESGMKGTDSFSSQLRTLLIPMGGDILRDMLLLLPLWIGLLFFQKRSTDIYASVSAYGIFVGRYLITILMPAAILTAGILPGVARTGSHIRKKKKDMPELHFRQEYRGRWYTDSFSRHGSRYWQYHCHRLWINLRKWHLPVCSLRDLR